MLKKLIYLLPFFVVVSAVAAPSTGLLNKNKSNIGVAKTVAITPKGQTTVKANPARVAKNLEVSKPNTDLSNTSVRFPSIKPKNKIIGTTQNINTNTNTNTNANPVSGNISGSDFNSLVQRVERLETNNANIITAVVENGSGPYVNDVKKDGNELNVKKTNLLYAPIKNASGQTVSDNAEIWIIK